MGLHLEQIRLQTQLLEQAAHNFTRIGEFQDR